MIAFIKNYNLETIRKKFIILYLLNVADIIFTLLLLQTGYFEEVNLLMVKAVQSPIVSLLLKVILPAILLFYMYCRIKSADASQLKVSNIAVNISLSIYTVVNLSHVVWVALLPVFMTIY
jgi:membrane-bound ClpP family serine protease